MRIAALSHIHPHLPVLQAEREGRGDWAHAWRIGFFGCLLNEGRP